MAYKKAFTINCNEPGCAGLARWEVFNDRNSNLGRYCTKHAERYVKRLDTELRGSSRKEREARHG